MQVSIALFLITIAVAIVFLLKIFNKKSKPNSNKNGNHKIIANDALITDGMLDLMAALLKSNKNEIEAKLDYSKGMMSKNFGDEKAIILVQKMKVLLEKEIDILDTCRNLRLSTSYQMRESLTQLLFRFACSHGNVSIDELKLLQLISNQMAIKDEDFKRIKRLYFTVKLTDFDLLEIDPTSDKRKIKAAFRKLVKKYHPDKLINPTEPEIRESTARFRKIQEAYNRMYKS